jgi:hypothetical protein
MKFSLDDLKLTTEQLEELKTSVSELQKYEVTEGSNHRCTFPGQKTEAPDYEKLIMAEQKLRSIPIAEIYSAQADGTRKTKILTKTSDPALTRVLVGFVMKYARSA